MRGGTTYSIGQLLEAADRESRSQREQGQTKVAQAAVQTESVDLLSTPAIMAMAQAGRKLASRMKLAEDDMEGSSGVNTGGTPSGMKDSLTPSADTPRQFYVTPTGKVDVSPSDNKYSIPTSTEQKSTTPSMNPGVSTPDQWLAPKIGQALRKNAQPNPPGFDERFPAVKGEGPVPASAMSSEARNVGTRSAAQLARDRGQPGVPAGVGPVPFIPGVTPGFPAVEGVGPVPTGVGADVAQAARDVGADLAVPMEIQGRDPSAAIAARARIAGGGGAVGASPADLAVALGQPGVPAGAGPVPFAPGVTPGFPAVAGVGPVPASAMAKVQSLDPIRAVHERYSRAAALLSKHAQPGGEAQPTTATGPMVGPGKPEASSPSGNTTGGTKPPTTFDGVRDLSRQDADAKALADAGAKTDLPVAAAKETTEGVLNEVLKAASADPAKAAAFRQWYSTLPQNSKIASLIRNRLVAAQKTAQDSELADRARAAGRPGATLPLPVTSEVNFAPDEVGVPITPDLASGGTEPTMTIKGKLPVPTPPPPPVPSMDQMTGGQIYLPDTTPNSQPMLAGDEVADRARAAGRQ